MSALACLFAPILAFAEPSASDEVAQAQWTAPQWIRAIDARIENLPALSYTARRTTERPDTRLEERWTLAWSPDQRFRIDYFGDTARQVFSDGRVLVDYIPARRQARRTDLMALPEADRRATLERVMAKVAIPGFRLGVARDVTWAVREEGGQVVLTGTGSNDSGLTYRVDPKRMALLSSELRSDGKVVLRTSAGAFVEVHDGTWLPSTVEMWAPDQGGEVRVTVQLTRLSAAPRPDGITLDLDPAVAVTAWP